MRRQFAVFLLSKAFNQLDLQSLDNDTYVFLGLPVDHPVGSHLHHVISSLTAPFGILRLQDGITGCGIGHTRSRKRRRILQNLAKFLGLLLVDFLDGGTQDRTEMLVVVFPQTVVYLCKFP